MVTCKISFENNNSGVFYSGSTINGIVEITVDKPTNVRSILLIINGEANACWTEARGDDRESVTYRANEKYIDSTTILHGSPNGNSVAISPGYHMYKFICKLPPGLPSSIEGYDGRIRYSAKVVFDRPWKFNKTFTTGITVIKTTDLNHENPHIRLPSTLEIQNKFWCCGFPSRPLILEATIPKSGYVSGENIPIQFNLFNMSGRLIKRFSVSLKQLINLKSEHPRTKFKVQTVTLTKQMIVSIENSEKGLFQANLIIPPVPPTCNEATCRVVQVSYEIHIKAYVNGPHTGPILKIPLIIGNVPLNSNDQFYNQESQSTNLFTPESGLLQPSHYEEPTYVEKVDMNVNEQHPIAESTYLPRYPVYKFNQYLPNLST